MKQILILYTSVGYGHKKIAENIGTALRDSFEVDLYDLSELEKTSPLMEHGTALYFWIIDHWPALWKFFYTNKIFLYLTLPLRTWVASFKYHKILKLLRAKSYNAVISAHVNSSAIMSYLKKKGLFNGKFIVAFSDFHLHWYWIFKNVDLYLANIPEQKEQMVARGVPANKILVCGITLLPKKEFNPTAVREKYGLPENKKLVLVMSGSKGLIFPTKLVEQLKSLDLEILIACGKNHRLEKNLHDFFGTDKNVKIFGYVENLPELYSIVDLILTKPGGLTISECLQYGLPMFVHSWLPGMEQMNYEYLLKHQLVLPWPSDLQAAVIHELHTGEFRAKLAANEDRQLIIADGTKIQAKLTELV